jgi:phosphohistidine phosphatase
MDLYLIRHAEALEIGERGITDDAERPLSEHGELQAQLLGKTLQKHGIALDHLYASPLVRAHQTAELILRALDRSGLTVETCDALIPGTRPRKLTRFLLKEEGEKVGIVGHMPHLGTFLGWLLGDKKINLDFEKAGVAYVTCGDIPGKGLATLQWLVGPDWY